MVATRLEADGFACYVPVANLERQWHDRKKVVAWPLFAGYVFVRFPLDRMAQVLQTHGIVTVVRFNGVPARIADAEIENVRRFVAALEAQGALPQLTPWVKGQEVQVVAGPFEGVWGTVAELRGSSRLVVSVGLQALDSGLRVEVDAHCVEHVASDSIQPLTA
ncbi:MAG: hypothetical protein MJB57_18640 [Gemmatimonadetes bacterium]|nr:hypothetical protein [Gemmatimonadota bacterium]